MNRLVVLALLAATAATLASSPAWSQTATTRTFTHEQMFIRLDRIEGMASWIFLEDVSGSIQPGSWRSAI